MSYKSLLADLREHRRIKELGRRSRRLGAAALDMPKLRLRSLRCFQAELNKAAPIISRLAGKPAEPLELKQLQMKNLLLTGYDHLSQNSPCQDALLTEASQSHVIAVLSDGAGAFELSHYGSKLLAEVALRVLKRLLNENFMERLREGKLLSPEFLSAYYCELYRELFLIIDGLGPHPEDAYGSFLCATLQIMLCTAHELLIFGLGDGFVGSPGDISSIGELTQRPARLVTANHPPLLICALAFDHNGATIRSSDKAIRKHLHREAQSFQLHHYSKAAELAKRPFLMASDGLRFCLPAQEPLGGNVFPAIELIENISEAEVSTLASLHNLCVDEPLNQAKIAQVKLLLKQRSKTSAYFERAFQKAIDNSPEAQGMSSEQLCSAARRGIKRAKQAMHASLLRAGRELLAKRCNLSKYNATASSASVYVPVPIWDDLAIAFLQYG